MGQTVTHKADAVKQFLIVRQTCLDKALQLALAEKIELKDIPVWSNRFLYHVYKGVPVPGGLEKLLLKIAKESKKGKKK